MSAPFRKKSTVYSVSPSSSRVSPLLGNTGRKDGCVLLATWSMAGHGLLSHSGYVSIYDIKMEYPITVSFRRVPVWEGGACAHLCPSLFLFSLSLSVAREVVSLSISLSHTYFFFSAEKFVEMYYLQLWKKKTVMSPFLFSSSSCLSFLPLVTF